MRSITSRSMRMTSPHSRSVSGRRMNGEGPYAVLIERRFRLACKRLGLNMRD
jgi:hypothetical protein